MYAHARPVTALLIVIATLGGPIAAQSSRPASGSWSASSGLLIQGATIVTMDDAHTVVPDGRVLVRDGRIKAIWSGPQPRMAFPSTARP